MSNIIQERLQKLREMMKQENIQAYYVPTADYHGSEYVNDYFKSRQFITGFTGSAGTAVITMDDAGLWTDGRYFVQAEKELACSTITMYKMGVAGEPSADGFISAKLNPGDTVGFDGRVVDAMTGIRLMNGMKAKGIHVRPTDDLIGRIWDDRPELPCKKVWVLDEKYSGVSAEKKLSDVRIKMKAMGADIHVITALDDICWLLNLRGDDIHCTPVVLSYMIIEQERSILFINTKLITEDIKAYLDGIGVTVQPYDDFYDVLASYKRVKILLERAKINFTALSVIDDSCRVFDRINPSSLMKCIKNPVEMENERKAHLKDDVAMIKYLKWIKESAVNEGADEYTAGLKLDQMRYKTEGNLGLSFDTISAYGENAAMCHYKAKKETAARLQARGLYLVDSGGQYYEGTTDITRTVALGELTEEERTGFTLVAASMLRLMNAKFIYGCHGVNLDYAARELLWSRGLDFAHGTGHGVGYLGGVHERPNSFRWKIIPGGASDIILEEGMITSDEPGLYIEGKFGIRTENLIMCVKDEANEFGQFMKFENLTWVPIDLDAIDVSLLEKRDIANLNNYHREVYEKMAPLLDDEHREWLKEATRAI